MLILIIYADSISINKKGQTCEKGYATFLFPLLISINITNTSEKDIKMYKRRFQWFMSYYASPFKRANGQKTDGEKDSYRDIGNFWSYSEVTHTSMDCCRPVLKVHAVTLLHLIFPLLIIGQQAICLIIKTHLY